MLGLGHRKVVLASSLALFFLHGLPGDASAQSGEKREETPSPVPQWLNWSAPPQCPPKEELVARLEAWLKAPLTVQEDLKVHASVAPHGETWHVVLQFYHGETAGQREVQLATCEEATDFVALTVALAIDPELDLEAGPSEVEPRTSEAEVPLPPPTHVLAPSNEAPPPVATFAAAPSPQSTTPAKEPQFEQAPAEPEAVEQPSIEPPPVEQPPVESPGLSWFLSAGARGLSGILPQFAVGPALGVGATKGYWLWSVAGYFLPGGTYSFDGWQGSARMSSGGIDGGACLLFEKGALGGGPCAHLQLGLVSAHERTASGAAGTRGGQSAILAVSTGAEGHLKISKKVSLNAGAQLSIPLLRPSFELSGGQEVFRSSLGFSGNLSLRYFF